MKDTSKIPFGPYCYSFSGGANKYGCPNIKACPYYSHKTISGLQICWCKFLDKGGIGDLDDQQYEKLLKKFGTKEKLFEELSLSLLWDMCKECGINYDFLDCIDEHCKNGGKILFWVCPNGCNDFVDWDKSSEKPVATCRKCGASNADVKNGTQNSKS